MWPHGAPAGTFVSGAGSVLLHAAAATQLTLCLPSVCRGAHAVTQAPLDARHGDI